MFGRFLFGALTGGVLVTAGLVLSSALFPLKGPGVPGAAEVSEATTTEPAVIASEDPVAPAEPVDGAEETMTGTEAAESVTEEGPAEPAAVVTESAPDASPDLEPTETGTEVVATVEPAVTESSQPEVAETAPAMPEVASDTPTETLAETPSVAEVTAPATPEAPATLPTPTDEMAEGLTDDTATTASPTGAVAEPEAATTSVPEPELAATAATTDPASDPAVEPALELAEVAPAEPAVVPVADPEPSAQPDPAAQPETAPAPETTAETVTEPVTEPAPEPAVEPEAVTEPEAPPLTEPEAAAEGTVATDEGTGSTFAPTPGFASDSTIVDTTAEIADETVADAALPVDAPPITRFAASFENPEAKPVLAIVLIDTGAADLDRAGLAALPFPVSFALDPMDPATPERAALYRAAGREVIMLATGIVPGAQASDIEVAFQSMTQSMPEAVAVMDLADPVFQNDRPLASLVVPVVGGEGRGVLTWEKGLNAADQVARRDDIASAIIFRDLAAGGGDSAAAQRTLDRAVFKAGQDGRVVVAGLVTPALVTALLEWSVEGRAGAVALAPLTAALKVD